MDAKFMVRVDCWGDRQVEVTGDTVSLQLIDGNHGELAWIGPSLLLERLEKAGESFSTSTREHDNAWVEVFLPRRIKGNKAVVKYLKRKFGFKYFEQVPLSPLATWKWRRNPNRRADELDYSYWSISDSLAGPLGCLAYIVIGALILYYFGK